MSLYTPPHYKKHKGLRTMKTEIKIIVEELQEGGYQAFVYDCGGAAAKGAVIYGNTLIQIRQRIGKRLEKLIVEDES